MSHVRVARFANVSRRRKRIPKGTSHSLTVLWSFFCVVQEVMNGCDYRLELMGGIFGRLAGLCESTADISIWSAAHISYVRESTVFMNVWCTLLPVPVGRRGERRGGRQRAQRCRRLLEDDAAVATRAEDHTRHDNAGGG